MRSSSECDCYVSKSCDEEANLSQQDNPLPIRPDDVVHLRAHSLPGQLGGAQARLADENINRICVLFDPKHSDGRSLSVCMLQQLTTSISVFEWPMLHTMEPFFIRSSWSLVTTFLFPVKKPRSFTSYRRYIEKLSKCSSA